LNRKTLTITVVAVVATALSVVIGARAIVGTAATLRHTTRSEEHTPGQLESTGIEVESLLEDLAAARTPDEAAGAERDPMVPYKPPKKPAPPKVTKPSRPKYKVTAVFIDADPTAVLIVNGVSQIVHVGDEVTGGRVVAIEQDGVTIEGDSGRKKVEYAPSNQ
jgi:hypothetical protein